MSIQNNVIEQAIQITKNLIRVIIKEIELFIKF